MLSTVAITLTDIKLPCIDNSSICRGLMYYTGLILLNLDIY